MPQYCAVPRCFEKKGGHKFPRDKERLKCWLAAIRRNNFVPSEHSRVCKKHFNAGDYELPKDSFSENPRPLLRKDAVPRKFPWNEKSYDALLQKKEERALQVDKKKKEFLERQLVEPDVVECPGMEIKVEPDVVECPGMEIKVEPDVVECPGMEIKVEPDVVECPGMEIKVETYEICKDVGTQCNLCNCDSKPHDSRKSNKNTIFSQHKSS